MECGTLKLHSKKESYWVVGTKAFHSVEDRIVLENETGRIQIPMKNILRLQLLMLQELRNDLQSAWFLREYQKEVDSFVSDYYAKEFKYHIENSAFINDTVMLSDHPLTSEEQKAKFLYWGGKLNERKQYRKLGAHLGCPSNKGKRMQNVCSLCNHPPAMHSSGYFFRLNQN